MPSIRLIPLSIIGLLLAGLHGNSAHAEVRVRGSIDNVRLEASDATVAEILAALRTRFDVHFRGTTPSRHLTGTYTGTLRGILARILDGYDYVIENHGANFDVIVLSSGLPRRATPSPTVGHRVD